MVFRAPCLKSAAMQLFLPQVLHWSVPAVLWLWVCVHLYPEWTLNSQYHYGWAVPFLAAFLFYLRWTSRPVPGGGSTLRIAPFLRWGLLFLLLPLRVVEEANPDWRLLGWSLGIVVVLLSLLAILRAGGPSWVAYFAFPICFPLVAVPWPVQIENIVIHGLTGAVAYAAVEVAGWIGIGAYQLGNVIQLANGFIGVDEACSGVKTLQSGIMVSLFLGEVLRLTCKRRTTLLLLGCGWIFFCNILRATALMIIASRSGISALEHRHDLVGGGVLLLGTGGLAGLAFILARKRGLPAATSSKSSTHPAPMGESGAALVWIVVLFATTELWYRVNERHLLTLPEWSAQWPQTEGTKPMAISDTTAAILRYSRGSGATWEGIPPQRWWGFFARWEPKRAALQLVRSHSPEICLPAIGRRFVRELSPVEFDEGDLQLPFRAYEFAQEGQPLFVFVCIQEDKTSGLDAASGPVAEWSARGRLRAAWNGERNLGQRLLELAVLGVPNGSAAQASLLKTIREIVRPGPATD